MIVDVSRKGGARAVFLLSACLSIAGCSLRDAPPEPWTAEQVRALRSLWIGELGAVPNEPTNAVANDAEAVRLGYRLFFDTRLSGNGGVACSSCHQPERRFTDGNAKAIGLGMSKRNAPSIIATAYSPWLYWDGRRDSLWSQALTPIEDPNEHGTDRQQVVELVATDPVYNRQYEVVFGAPADLSSPDAITRGFTNVGKAIAAYERILLPGPSRFDRYVEAVLADNAERQAELFSADEIRGLQLFIGRAACTQCHNGPLLTNNEFHNTGTISFPGDAPDKGRIAGVSQVLADAFNCRGAFSDAGPDDCFELDFVRSGPELIGAFRTPSLRNLAGTEPYMHKGQLKTLRDVLVHYNEAPPAMIGHSELDSLDLNERELRQLEAFLQTLDAPLATEPRWLSRPTS